MASLGDPYYVGLRSAAGLHGAAHQQPQEFQVVTARARRPMVAGRARIRFLVKRDPERASTAYVQTETGTGIMRVPTPESTALDLVQVWSAPWIAPSPPASVVYQSLSGRPFSGLE